MQIKKDIQKKLSTLKDLPSLPHILIKLIAACNKDDVSISEVSRIVEKDPSLSSKIVKLVNSAYYGLPKKTESIQYSISFLGTSTIKSIAIGSSVHQAFRPPEIKGLYNLKTFWWHSLRCAVLARLIANEVQYKNPEEAFLTGLLHDVGRLVLWVNFPEYSGLLEKYSERPDLLLAGEIRQGVTHCEVGAWLLQHWKLQSFIVDAVLYHHESTKRIIDAFSLVQIIWVANTLAEMPVGQQDENGDVGFAEDLCGLSPFQVNEILARTSVEVEDVAVLLDIAIEAPGKKEAFFSEKDFEKKAELDREVRDSSLLLGTLQNLLAAHDEDAILRELHQGLHILFDITDVLFFFHDVEKRGLLGKTVKENERSELIDDLFIPMETERCLSVSALLHGKPVEFFIEHTAPDTALIDLQLIRFFGTEGILCVPLMAHGEYVGVIIIGLSRMEFAHLSQDFNLLNMFSKHAAMAFHADKMRRAQVKNIQTARVGASSDVARKVVHEVNNPLGIIKNYLKILELKLSAQDIVQDEISIINKEIDRIALLLRTLTSFSGREAQNTGLVDVNVILADIEKITRESFREKFAIDIHMDLEDSLPEIISDGNSLKQIFINLIKNAAEAMTAGGNLYVTTKHLSSCLGNVSESEQKKSQGYVEIFIIDDGSGIPDEILSRVFDPFVTSKGSGHSGLGLSIVHNLIKALNGTLTCESDREKGTCFKIGLPI